MVGVRGQELAVGCSNDPADKPFLVTLDPERFDALVRLIESPPAPGPKLAALLRRVPAWTQ